MQSLYDKINQMLTAGDCQEALRLIEAGLQKAEDAYLYYLKGKLYMKTNDWQKAQTAFMQAENLSPEGPGAEARQMLSDILAFYNKDLYNP